MCVAGVQPSPDTLAQLVCVLASKSMWDDALAILASMCRCARRTRQTRHTRTAPHCTTCGAAHVDLWV